MSTRPAPQALPIAAALDASVPLARLMQRLQDSNARWQAVLPALPPALRERVRAGPVDDDGWSLLAANPAVAAKLRQLVPRLQSALAAAGHGPTAIRVKVAVDG